MFKIEFNSQTKCSLFQFQTKGKLGKQEFAIIKHVRQIYFLNIIAPSQSLAE